jgi:glycerol-3-phosphate dehydrogenase
MLSLPWIRRREYRSSANPPAPLRLVRSEQQDRLASETFDILIVGGGVTGAYCAFDASLRGFRVALVEKDDFASGTSSKSSKMVHGGLRYIEQGNLGLVRRSLTERQRLRRNAPHLVQRLPFLFPVLERDGVLDARLARAFESLLWTYDLAGGWREGILHRKLTADEVLAHCPTFRGEHLRGGLMYYDARVDDARLTLALARSAAFHGATILNHARAAQIVRSRSGAVEGAIVHTVEGREIRVRARSAIMATGVWLRDWMGTTPDADRPLHVRPAKGVHVAIPWIKVRNACTVTIPVPGRSRRATMTRWGNVAYLGTTDEDYRGDLDDVHCTRRELDFLLEGLHSALDVDLGPQDVLGSIAGCRPLVATTSGGSTTDVRRDHSIHVGADGLVTVVGGKLTTARHMAEQTVDAAASVLGDRRRCRTARTGLLGAAGYDAQAAVASGGLQAHLAERHGMEACFVSDLMQSRPELGEPVVDGLPHTCAEVVYAARHEMALTVDDVLSRRMRARLMARDASARAAVRVGMLIGQELRLSAGEVDRQVADYVAATDRERSILMGADGR